MGDYDTKEVFFLVYHLGMMMEDAQKLTPEERRRLIDKFNESKKE